MLGRSVVAQADVTPLRMQSSQLDARASSIDSNANTLVSKFTGAPWTGKARDAADNRAESERREHRRVADDIRGLAKQLTSGADGIDRLATTLRRDSTNLEAENYSVAEQWKVTDLLNYELGFYVADAENDSAARAQLERLQKERAEEAARETHRLTGLAHDLTALDQQTASAITSHLQTIARLAPPAAGLSKSRAERDMATLTGKNLDGSTPTDQEERDAAERLHAAADLDKTARDSLDQTGKAGISQEKFDYLKGVAAQLPDKVSNYDDIGGDLGPEQSTAVQGDVADTLRILGNPGVATPNGERGGMDRLPKNVQTLLTQTPTESGSVMRPNKDGKSDTGVPTVELKRFDDWRALTNTLGSGDQDLRLGSDVDRGLLKQASEIAGKLTPSSEAQLFSADSQIPDQDHQVRMTLDAMLNNASGDHQAVHDLVTGDNMKATISGGGAYNASDHLMGLIQHQWSPDEHGARNVFNWLDDPANISSSGLQGKLSGETATGLGNFLADNANHLNHLRVADGAGDILGSDSYTTLGQVNPELTRSLASNLTPYLGGFTGIPDSVLANHFTGEFKSVDQLSSMFSVLDGDPQAATTINHGAQDWIKFAALQAGQHSDLSAGLGHSAGLLDSSLEKGLTSQIDALKANGDWADAMKENSNGTVFDTGAAALGMVPGVGPGIGILAPGVKMDLLGNVTPPDAITTDVYTDALNKIGGDGSSDSLRQQFSYAEGYLATHQSQRHLLGDYLEGGKLSWGKVVADKDTFIGAVSDFFGYNAFSDSFKSGLIDDKIDPREIPAP